MKKWKNWRTSSFCAISPFASKKPSELEKNENGRRSWTTILTNAALKADFVIVMVSCFEVKNPLIEGVCCFVDGEREVLELEQAYKEFEKKVKT